MQADGRKTVRFVLFCCFCKEIKYRISYFIGLLCKEKSVVAADGNKSVIPALLQKRCQIIFVDILICPGIMIPFCFCSRFNIQFVFQSGCFIIRFLELHKFADIFFAGIHF